MRQEIRNRILQIALERFNEDGFKEVTTDSLSKDIGISKKTLYVYFKSKEEIFETIYLQKSEIEKSLFEATLNRIAEDCDIIFLDELKELTTIGSKLKFRYSKLFFRDLKIYFPYLWENELLLRSEYSRKSFDIIWQKGIENGIFRTDLNKQIIYLMQLEVFNKLLDPEVLQNIPGTIDEIIENIFNIFFFGVMNSNQLLNNRQIQI